MPAASAGLQSLLLLALASIGTLQAQVSKMNDSVLNAEQAKASQVAAPARAEDYVIGPDDLLNVYVLDVPELSRDYRVSAAGTITVPVLATPLDASGLTLSEFSKPALTRTQGAGFGHRSAYYDIGRPVQAALGCNCRSGETAASLSAFKPNYIAGYSLSGGGFGGRCRKHHPRSPGRYCEQGLEP